MAQDLTAKVITGKVRFCYAHVFEPSVMEGSTTEKYSVSIVIDKDDKYTLGEIDRAVKNALRLGEGKLKGKTGKIYESAIKMPLRNGDEQRPDDDAYAGKMFVTANSTNRPGVVDANLNKIIDKDEFYSGCYGRASLTFYAYDFQGTKGIAVGLNNVQKLEDGERLSGGSSPESDFGDDLA